MECLTVIEKDYQAAKARLLTAPCESAEAIVEFVSARAVLRQMLEDLWPSSDELCECSPGIGYHVASYGQHKTR